MTLPLLHRPIPFEDESPGSLLIRISESNGWQSPSSLLVAQNYRFSNNSTVNLESTMCNQTKWDDILESFAITNESTYSVCYNRLDRTNRGNVDFLGIPVPKNKLRLHNPAICPKCLKENNYQKKIWDLKLMTSCSKHGIKLIDSCPSCNEKINWNRKNISKCKCGKSLELFPHKTCVTTVTNYVEHLIKSKNTKALNLLLELHNVYEEFYKFTGMYIDQHDLLRLCFQNLNHPDKANKILNQNLDMLAKTKGFHPRLALYPFLLSNIPEIIKIAQDCLNKYKYRKPNRNRIEGNIGFTATSRVLGLSLHRVKTLINFKILEKPKGYNSVNKSPLLITLESINSLLITSSKCSLRNNDTSNFKTFKELTNTYQYCHTFIELIQGIISGDREYSGDRLTAEGFKGISIRPPSRKRPIPPKAILTIKETAELCDVHYENIRFAIHSGILKRNPSEETKGTAIYINKNDAQEFNRRYIFSGSLAKQYGFQPTNLAEKIFATGVKAISGPGIDGGLIYLFRRVDLDTLDMIRVNRITGYPTKTGRRKHLPEYSQRNSISLLNTSKLLKVSVQRASQLLSNGFIVEYSSLSREKRITNESVQRILKIRNDSSLIQIQLAANSIKESMQKFRLRWLKTNFVDSINTGLDCYITKVDLIRIKDFKRQNIIASDAKELTGVNESQIRAYKNNNIIKISQQLGSGRNKVIFYNKEEVLCVCHR